MCFAHVHYKRCPTVYAMWLAMSFIIIQVYCNVISFTEGTHICIILHTKINFSIHDLVIYLYIFFLKTSCLVTGKLYWNKYLIQVWTNHNFKWQVASSIAVISYENMFFSNLIITSCYHLNILKLTEVGIET